MSSWIRAVEWLLHRKLSIWNLSFPNGQFNVYSYVLLTHCFLPLF